MGVLMEIFPKPKNPKISNNEKVIADTIAVVDTNVVKDTSSGVNISNVDSLQTYTVQTTSLPHKPISKPLFYSMLGWDILLTLVIAYLLLKIIDFDRFDQKFKALDKQIKDIKDKQNNGSRASSPKTNFLLEEKLDQLGQLTEKVKDLEKTLEDQARKVEALVQETANKEKIKEEDISKPEETSQVNEQPIESKVLDYHKVLEEFLLTNYYKSSAQLLEILESLHNHIDNDVLLKDRIIRITQLIELNVLNERKILDFCDYVNNYLSRHSIAIYAPKLGTEFDETSMNKKAQYSPSTKVSKISLFGITHANRVVLKAEVALG